MKLLSPILFFLSTVAFSQGIVIDTTSLSVPDLVHIVLMQNSCSNESNVVSSSHLGIGNFTNTNPSFPFTDGIVIRNGIAKYTEGPYTGINESSQISTSTDADLQAISILNGQVAAITDVGFIQFDFTPLSNNFSFDFLFASNEYGEYQCGFSDVFAFLLTDLTTNAQTNLAVIPGTSTPVTVKNIRDNAYNSSCLSNNAALFSRYNVTDPASSAINMRGETVLLTASSPVIPNRTYRIKLAIGDYYDSNYDSAVFIKGGSFTTTTNLGPDKTICQGETSVLTSGILPPFLVSWTLNGVVIIGENNTTLTVTQPGVYGVIGTLPNSGCRITDEIVIVNLALSALNDLTVCNSGQTNYSFDLTQNNLATLGLNTIDYSIAYYASLADANANSPQIPTNLLNAYLSPGAETIYIKLSRLLDGNTICGDLIAFNLIVNPVFITTTPPNLILCSVSSGSTTTDLTLQNPIVLNGQIASDFNISCFTTSADAQNNSNAIANPSAFQITLAQSPLTIWVRMGDISNPACFNVVRFTITVYPQPIVDSIPNAIECHSYTLPVIINGNYFTGSNGSGTMLHAGDIIMLPGTYYIFNGPDANGCTNESSFTIILIDQITFPLTACGAYVIPLPPAGNFFTAAGGLGTIIPSGTLLTSSQTIYYYAVINGVVCRDEAFPITVIPLPLADDPTDVLTCNSYILPVLTNGDYYSGSNGTGLPLIAGNTISTSTIIYVYAANVQCKNNNPFRVDIVDTSIYQPIVRCGSFTLPAIPFGNYHSQPSGGGTIIPSGTSITTSQIVYYYANTTTTPNCTDLLNYDITIKPLPLVDTPADRLECNKYVLPVLNNGSYYTAVNGGGTLLSAGTIISVTKTIYIYALGINGCSNQYTWHVVIKPLPLIDSFTDIFTCMDFILPTLTNGKYYTATNGPNGTGNLLASGTAISSSQRIYIYNERSDFIGCTNETYFNIQFSGIDVGTFADVSACDSYRLPPLTLVADYYSLPNGAGPIIPVGTVLTTSQRIYVYKIVGTRLTCSDQDDFLVTISPTPVLINSPDVVICGGYLLPTLISGNYFSQALGAGTAYSAGQNITTSQQMYIYAVAATNATCFDQDDFNITVYPLKNLNINDGVICIDNDTGALLQPYVMNSGLNPAIFTVEWYLNGVLVGTGQRYTAVQEGTYTVVVIKNTPDVGSDCGYNSTTVIVEKSSTAIATVTVSDAFVDVIDVTVNVTGGFGDYEFQIDGGAFQTSNVFYDVASGVHTISIKDNKGDCNRLNLIAHVIKYPNYFTPNGDGYHETWNLIDLDFQPDATLYIYDRYGKFIQQLKTNGPGWDGNYNGNPLPSTDYWFQVFYELNGTYREFKSHFSMKR
ncbi:Gliding motility-associated, C-terminal domain [Flavobacteriaceae bacterium]